MIISFEESYKFPELPRHGRHIYFHSFLGLISVTEVVLKIGRRMLTYYVIHNMEWVKVTLRIRNVKKI
jgi:hypothetical protein